LLFAQGFIYVPIRRKKQHNTELEKNMQSQNKASTKYIQNYRQTAAAAGDKKEDDEKNN